MWHGKVESIIGLRFRQRNTNQRVNEVCRVSALSVSHIYVHEVHGKELQFTVSICMKLRNVRAKVVLAKRGRGGGVRRANKLKKYNDKFYVLYISS